MRAFSAALLSLLPLAVDRNDAVDAVRAFVAYLNPLTAWSFPYFPWDLGEDVFRYAPETVVSDPILSVKVTPGRLKAKLTWQPLKVTVVALLAESENEELIAEFVGVLPFTVLQEHAVVSGESMYAWVPLVSTAAVRVKERQCDAPVGRIRYSQKTGNKVVIQYGQVTEDIETPVLDEVLPEYGPQLAEVGRCSEQYFPHKAMHYAHHGTHRLGHSSVQPPDVSLIFLGNGYPQPLCFKCVCHYPRAFY